MKAALLLLALLALTGCSAPAPQPGGAGPVSGTQPYKRVTVDPALRGILRVNKILDQPSALGFLQFQVDVVNLTSSAKTITYEVDWLDGAGVPLGISIEMPPHTLFPRETFPMTLTAPAPAAKDFHLTFRLRNN